jgi:hypothetical protein
MLTAAKDAFTSGLAIAAGVGSASLLASAAAVWLLLKTPKDASTFDSVDLVDGQTAPPLPTA